MTSVGADQQTGNVSAMQMKVEDGDPAEVSTYEIGDG